MISRFKGLLVLSVFAIGTVVGGTAYAECAGHKSTTASIDGSLLTASDSTNGTKKPVTGG